MPFALFFVVLKNASQSTVMRVNNKKKQVHQMSANADGFGVFSLTLTHFLAKTIFSRGYDCVHKTCGNSRGV